MRFPKGCNILYNWGYALDTLSIPNPFLLSKCVHGFNWVKIWKSTLHEDSSHQWVQPFLLEATSSIFKEPHRPYPPNHPSMSFWLTCKNAHRLVGENGSSVTNFSGDFFSSRVPTFNFAYYVARRRFTSRAFVVNRPPALTVPFAFSRPAASHRFGRKCTDGPCRRRRAATILDHTRNDRGLISSTKRDAALSRAKNYGQTVLVRIRWKNREFKVAAHMKGSEMRVQPGAIFAYSPVLYLPTA